ncbi:MAG: hypothetical protein POELPBGB_00379 [Bacteroidia bacterium]|nr:hypothetical protein [Bacteroidia bacterium]
MLPYITLEFEKHLEHGWNRLYVNPVKTLNGLQNHELVPMIQHQFTFLLSHPLVFGITIQVSGAGPVLDRLFAETKKDISVPKVIICFTLRQLQLIRFTKQGYTGNEIARLMNIKLTTVKKHRKLIYKKLSMAYGKPLRKGSILWYADMAGIR